MHIVDAIREKYGYCPLYSDIYLSLVNQWFNLPLPKLPPADQNILQQIKDIYAGTSIKNLITAGPDSESKFERDGSNFDLNLSILRGANRFVSWRPLPTTHEYSASYIASVLESERNNIEIKNRQNLHYSKQSSEAGHAYFQYPKQGMSDSVEAFNAGPALIPFQNSFQWLAAGSYSSTSTSSATSIGNYQSPD